MHRPKEPRLKLPPGQKLLKTIAEVKAQAPECKSNSIMHCQSDHKNQLLWNGKLLVKMKYFLFSSKNCLNLVVLGVLPTESVEDTCIIEPDLEQNEIVEDTLEEEEEEVAAEESSTKTENNEESISLDFSVIEDEDTDVADIKSDEENTFQVVEVLSSTSGSVVLSGEIGKDQFWEEFTEIGKVDEKDQEKTSKEEENAKESVWKGKEDKDQVEVKSEDIGKEEVDEVEEVGGFAPQALASIGFGLGLSVHGSALVFPAVALPRLKQVSLSSNDLEIAFTGSLQNYIQGTHCSSLM